MIDQTPKLKMKWPKTDFIVIMNYSKIVLYFDNYYSKNNFEFEQLASHTKILRVPIGLSFVVVFTSFIILQIIFIYIFTSFLHFDRTF